MDQEAEVLIGVDPGAKGGLAWVYNGKTITEKMPDTVQELVEILRDAQMCGRLRMFLEEVGGYAGGDGAPGSAMFNFGRNYGNIEGVAAALGIPVELVRPQKWQKALGAGTTSGRSKTEWKNHLKSMAARLHPELKVTLSTADALLILHAAKKGLI